MKARVFITLKNGVLDPQGKAIHHALEGLGFGGVNDVRAGKLIELDLAEDEVEPVRDRVQIVVDALGTFAHLTENTAELDLRCNANWENMPA